MKYFPISHGLDSNQADSRRIKKHGWWRSLTWQREPRNCIHRRGLWRRLGSAHAQVCMEGSLYCVEECLEPALVDTFRRIRSGSPSPAITHRVPLGLLLLSRQQLTAEQLRRALEAQRAAGRGRLGEWLEALGFVGEDQITAALARQWSCPILRSYSPLPTPSCGPRIPSALLERFRMVPVHYAESTATLHVAFGEAPDYSALYAIEKMLGCRTACCLARPSFVRRCAEALSAHRGESEVSLACETDAEFSRMVCSYCARVRASEVRLAACGPNLWVRLLAASRLPLDLWMHSRHAATASSLQTTKAVLAG
jgi:hypothetical protein